jgi:hypothetical protein
MKTDLLQLGSRRELFVDHVLIERLDKAALKLHEPVSGGVAIRIDKPWEGPMNFGSTVIHHRGSYPLTGILPAGDGRLQMFVTRHYMQDSWHIERLLLRTDGFASVSAPWAGGEMVTKPLTFTGSRLEINYRTGAPGFVRVEILDGNAPYNGAATDEASICSRRVIRGAGANGVASCAAPIPGFTLDDCPEIVGDECSRVVSWKQGPDLSRLADKPVRLRFVMKDADLFALQFH